MGRMLAELKKTISEMNKEELADQTMETRKGRATMTTTKINAVRKRTKKSSLQTLLKGLSKEQVIKMLGE